MELTLANKSAVVTGGSKGLGRAMALTFARAGARVAICARGKEKLDEAAKEIAQDAPQVYAALCDVSEEAAVKRFVGDAAAAFGGIDIVVNNASGLSQGDDEAGWAAGINIDLLGAVRVNRAAMPWLERSGKASIINICTIRALVGSARIPAYAAVKAALANYTISQSVALAAKAIRVNAIAPGSIEYPGGLWERRRLNEPAAYKVTVDRVPFGRLGTAQEVANVALFLASDAASWVTGQVIAVDGGQSRT